MTLWMQFKRQLTAFAPVILLAMLVGLLLVACGGDEDQPEQTPAPVVTATPEPPPVTPSATPEPRPTGLPIPASSSDPRTGATLRVLHASTDLPALSVYLGGASLGQLAAGSYHNRPIGYEPGEYVLRVVPAGEDPDITTPLVSQPVELAAGQSVIALVVGTADSIRVILHEEDLSPLPAMTARLSVIHAVPRGPAFDLQETNREVIPGLDFGMAGGPVEISAERHSYDFISGPEILTSTDLRAGERMVHTLVLLGTAGGGDYRVVTIQTRANSETQFRMIQASPNMPPVDVYLDEQLLAAEVAYRDSIDWAAYASQAYDLRLLPPGEPDADPLWQRRVTLNPDRAITLVLLDDFERLRVLQIDGGLEPTPVNGTRITFVNAAIGTTNVAIETLGEHSGPDSISFGTATRPTIYTAGEEGFYFYTADDERDVDYLSPRDWQAGYAYTIVLTDYADTEPLTLETEVGTNDTMIAADGIIPLDDTSTNAFDMPTVLELRMVNALDDDIPIDLLFNSESVFESVARGAATVYQRFDEPPTRITIQHSETGEILVADPLSIPASGQATIFVFREPDGVTYVFAAEVPFALPQNQSLLRVLHAVPDRPRLHITHLSGPAVTVDSPTPAPDQIVELALSDTVAFGRVSDAQPIDADTYDIRVVEADSGTLVLNVPDVTFEPGASYDLLLLPDASGLSISPLLVPHR